MSIEAMNNNSEVPDNRTPLNGDILPASHLKLVPESTSTLDHIDFNQLKHYLEAKEKPNSIDVIVLTATQIGILPQELDEADKEVRLAAIHAIERAYEIYDVLFTQTTSGTTDMAKRHLLQSLTQDCDETVVIKALEEVALKAKNTSFSKLVIDALRIARITMLIQDPDQTKLKSLLGDN